MQVKKFEAPTMQEALDTIKRELGPEAIILQTKRHKRGFGLMSQESVEVTAAISDRSLNKKQFAENRLPEPSRQAVRALPAEKQASIYDKYMNRYLQRGQKKDSDQVSLQVGKKLTATRYIDIDPQEVAKAAAPQKKINIRSASLSAAVETAQSKQLQSMAMEEEIRHLKRMIEEMKIAQEESIPASGAQALQGDQGSFATPALQDAYEQMILNGIERRYALNLIKRVSFELGPQKIHSLDLVLDELASEIIRGIDVSATLKKDSLIFQKKEMAPVVIALIGPTGVGKTTTVAKIASDAFLKQNLKVGLINLDHYKIAAVDQLSTYAKILNVPFRSVSSANDLISAMQDFQNLDLVLIDTTGRSQKDPTSLSEMLSILSSVPQLQCELVLAVTTRDTELYDTANRFSIFKPKGVIFSKLDEAAIYGSIYNVAQKIKLPLAYFTTGQRVPEDIEDATGERVAALVLDL